jgi:hydroxydechloroatrazine ethylaminohydrolase
MTAHLFKGCAAVICDPQTVMRDVDLLVEGPKIAAIGKSLSAPAGTDVIDARGWFLYPGLVNTHHHFFQTFVRNRADLDWTKLSVIEWLDLIYPIFARLTEDCFYHSSLTAMAELAKHGCTTAFDHQYNFPRHAGKRIVDRQFEAAARIGLRFHAGRGGNTLPKSEGSTIPDEMLESTDEFIADCARLIDAYHDPAPFSMAQVVVSPCQPVNCYRETFVESAALARDKRVFLHTHVGEGESPVIAARHGMRTVDYLEQIGFAGPDTFYAHCWELNRHRTAPDGGLGDRCVALPRAGLSGRGRGDRRTCDGGAWRAGGSGVRRGGVERQLEPDALHPLGLHAAMPRGFGACTSRAGTT